MIPPDRSTPNPPKLPKHKNNSTASRAKQWNIPQYSNNLNCCMSNQPISSPYIFSSHLICPIVEMNKQIKRSDKIELHPIHCINPNFHNHIRMNKQMNRCFLQAITKNTPS